MESRYLGHGFWFKIIGTSLPVSVYVTVWNCREGEGVRKDIETILSLVEHTHMSQVVFFCCCGCLDFSPPFSFSLLFLHLSLILPFLHSPLLLLFYTSYFSYINFEKINSKMDCNLFY